MQVSQSQKPRNMTRWVAAFKTPEGSCLHDCVAWVPGLFLCHHRISTGVASPRSGQPPSDRHHPARHQSRDYPTDEANMTCSRRSCDRMSLGTARRPRRRLRPPAPAPDGLSVSPTNRINPSISSLAYFRSLPVARKHMLGGKPLVLKWSAPADSAGLPVGVCRMEFVTCLAYHSRAGNSPAAADGG